jgi:uncharacterized membrane protein YuzA (DUF378 family)
MMSQRTIAVLQSILVAAQFINVGLVTVTRNALVTLIAGAVVAGLTALMNQIGNASISEPVKTRLSELDALHQANAAAVTSAAAQSQPAVPPAPAQPHGWGK